MKRVANRDASWYVEELKEFKGNNTFANWEDNKYIVYSYGTHWILYMYLKDTDWWLGCSEKKNMSTSKHSTQLHPNLEIDDWLSQGKLQQIKNGR